MQHQYLAFTMRSMITVILLAAFIVNSVQQSGTTATAPVTATNDANSTDTNSADSTTPDNATNTNTSTIPIAPTMQPTTTTIKTTTTPKPPGNLRPVGETCLNLYFKCTEKSQEFVKGNFCQAFTENVPCFNTSDGCTVGETNLIKYVDCGPNLLLGSNTTVGTLCQGRITECLSLSAKPEDIKITTDFKTFFCSKQTKECLTYKRNTTVCTDAEYTTATAKCTAAHTVISSALFIILAVLAQRIICRY